MSDVDSLVDLIEEAQARWAAPVIPDILGTNEPAAVATALAAGIATAIGQPVASATSFRPGVGIVVGVRAADGRDLVAKVHRSSYVTEDRLAAIVDVQATLAAGSALVPAPVAGPVALGRGWLTIEEHRGGERADGYRRDVRRAMAEALVDLVERARAHAGDHRIGGWLGAPAVDGLWPEPHDVRFDFAATARGAEWIDDAGRAAKGALASLQLPDVVGHLDWRVENLGFAGDRVVAIYDWDSLGLVPEATLVGTASVAHPVDWRRELPDPLPTLDQLDGFVADYQAARGAPFGPDERQALEAGQLWLASYGARCQHSDQVLGIFPDVDHALGWPRLLRDLLGRRE